MSPDPRILCVDDEPMVLSAIRRTLASDFEVDTAISGAEAVERLRGPGVYAVILSDMTMPGMSGIELLRRAKEMAPDTVRLLLTGQRDVDTAMAAVNDGAVFRFLGKPCPPDALRGALHAAVKQHQLITAEKQLLELTLAGALNLMSEVLEMAAPAAFQRASWMRARVSAAVRAMGIADLWIFEAAASVSQIGCVALPAEVAARAASGAPLTPDDEQSWKGHPEVGFRLLSPIPRLDAVAEIVRRQMLDPLLPPHPDARVQLGAELLFATLSMDLLVAAGVDESKAIDEVASTGRVRADIVRALQISLSGEPDHEVQLLRVGELTARMILDEDVRTPAGIVVVRGGKPVDSLVLERLQRFERGTGLVQPIRVRVPR